VNSNFFSSTLFKFTLIPTIPLILLFIFSYNLDTRTTGTDHFYFEIISVILSFIAAYYCIWRGYALKNKLSLFIGLGFHAAGIIDLLHSVFSIMNLGASPFEAYFIPQTWVAGRILLGIVMMIAVTKFGNQSNYYKTDETSLRNTILYASLGLASLATVITVISLTHPFPFVTIDFIIKRPYELISATIFLIALVYFYKNKLHYINDSFYQAIVLTLLINVFSNIIISTSSLVFDTLFIVAHALKIVSYFVFVIAVSSSSVHHYKMKNQLAEDLEQANEKLYANQRKYRDLYDLAPAMYRTIDTKGMILDCNHAYADTLGYSKAEIIGSSIYDYVPPDHLNKIKDSFEEWSTTGRVQNREVWLVKKNGESFPTLLSAGNIYDSDKKLIGSNTVIRDISEIHTTKKRLEEAYEELKQTDIQKNEFASMITHELRTPLTPIMGFSQALKSTQLMGQLSEKQLLAVNKIYSNAKKLDRLIADILDAQKLDLNQMKFIMSEFLIDKLFVEVIQNYGLLIKERKILVNSYCANNISLNSDRNRIGQVLENLIKNALEFLPVENGVIQLSAERVDESVVISVNDNGSGIPKEKQKDLFKKFYQVDTSDTRKHSGTGLGLAICKGIVESLDGQIWVESEVDKGSTFYIRLPSEAKN